MQLRVTSTRFIFSAGPIRLATSAPRLLFILLLLAGAFTFYSYSSTHSALRKRKSALWKTAANALAEICETEYASSLRPRLLEDPAYVLASISSFAPRVNRDSNFFPNASHIDHGGFKIWVYRTSGGVKDQVSRMLLQNQVWEKEISDFLLGSYLPHASPFETPFDPTGTGYMLKERDRTPRAFLDIGCNLGYFSLLLASKGITSVCVEPLPKNLGLLVASICENEFHASQSDLEKGVVLRGSVVVFPYALDSTADPSCRLLVDTANIGNAKLICTPRDKYADVSHGDAARLPFPDLGASLFSRIQQPDPPVLALSDILPAPKSMFPNGLRVLSAKLDVEGFEERVIAGLDLNAGKPRFIVSEVDPALLKLASKGANDRGCCGVDSYLARLRAAGYELYALGDKGRDGRFRRLGKKGTLGDGEEDDEDDERSLNVFGELRR